MEYYVGYATPASYDVQHHGILGMKWGVRRYQPYPSGYTGDGKYVGDRVVDRSAAKSNLKRAIKDINKSGRKSYEASKEIDKAKMVLGEDYVHKAIRRDNTRKAVLSALKNTAIVAAGAAATYAMQKSLNDYYAISSKHLENPMTSSYKNSDGSTTHVTDWGDYAQKDRVSVRIG